jgi:hypothetical protein
MHCADTPQFEHSCQNQDVKRYGGVYRYQLSLSGMGKRAVLSVAERKDVCMCKEQYPGARQQNIANYFSFLWHKPTKKLALC